MTVCQTSVPDEPNAMTPGIPPGATPEWVGKVSLGALLTLVSLLLSWAVGSLQALPYRLGPVGQCVFGLVLIPVGVVIVWLVTAPPGQRAWLSGRRFAARAAAVLGAAMGVWSNLYRLYGPLSGPARLVEILPPLTIALGMICALVELRYVIALAKAIGARFATVGYRIIFWLVVVSVVLFLLGTVVKMPTPSEAATQPKAKASPALVLGFMAALFAFPVAVQLSFVVRLRALKRSLTGPPPLPPQ